MFNRIIIFFLLLLHIPIVNAQKFTISGYVINANSDETLISSSIYDLNSKNGTVSNSYGFYSLTIPKGKVEIIYTYIGFATQSKIFELTKDTIINIKLSEYIELNELTVLANKKEFGVKGSQMSAIDVPVSMIKTVPTLFGEADVLKALQLLPGVQAGSEGSSGIYVRGGGPDENLFLLDGVAVYNVNHLVGFFSVFNTDAVKNVTMYKGGFPARFGGRLSSVVDIRMNDGNNQKIHGNLTLGLISSKINLEGPLFNPKTTFNISARRSYFDIFSKSLMNFDDNDGFKASAGYYFYDFNTKLTHKFSDRNRIFLSYYMGNDDLNSELTDSYSVTETGSEIGKINIDWNWGNIISAFRWNHVINNKLFMNSNITYTNYKFKMLMGNELTSIKINPPSEIINSTNLEYNSGIIDYGLKLDFDYMPGPKHDIKFGTSYAFHVFEPGVTADRSQNDENNTTTQNDTTYNNSLINSQETILFFEDNYSINSFLKANIGLHFSTFNVQKTFYKSLQPRLSLRALLSDKLSLKFSYANMQQYVHLLSYNNFSLPNDLWVPVTKKIQPMKSNQYSTGIFYSLLNLIDLSVEGYYKNMDNLIEYLDGSSFFSSGTGWEDKVAIGKGWAYGIEFLAQKTVGKTTGWLGYTWSKSERLFNRKNQELNNGEVFPAKYDRTNDLSFVLSHKLNEKIDFSGTLKYSSGNYVTLAFQNYKGFSEFDSKLPYFGKRNNYRMPDYFRIDVGVNLHKQLKYGKRTWNFSLYNASNQMNPFYLFVSTKKYIDPITLKEVSEKVFNKITVFPIIPSISYTYKF
jgi:hypothetical protein